MDLKFGKNKNDREESAEQTQEKGKQTGMLVLLLILLGGFGYIYFFTSLIRPQESPPLPPSPPAQVVKQPLPARDAAPVSAPNSTDLKAVSIPAASPSAVPVEKPVKKTADATKVSAAPAVKPVPAKPETKKIVPAKVEQQQVAAVKSQEKPVELVKKQAPASKMTGPWTVVVGIYVVEETLAEDMAKVKKTGLTPVMTSGPKRPIVMHRLFYGEYTSKEQAQHAVETLQRTAGSGFFMQKGERFEVYAGSYAVLSGAKLEQQRLAASGIKVTVRKTQVPLASRKLTAGTFTNRKVAADVLKKLKSAGIGTPEIE